MRRRYANLPIHVKILAPFAVLIIVWGGFGTAVLVHGTASEARGRATAQLGAAFDGARATLADDERNLLGTVRLAANTQGVAAAAARRDASTLRSLLEPLAVNARNDHVRVVDATGAIVVAIDLTTGSPVPSQESTLALESVLRAARGDADERGDKYAALTPNELLVAGPIRNSAGRAVGAVVVSDNLARVAARMGRGTGVRAVIFSESGEPLAGNGGPLPFDAASVGLHTRIRVDGESMETLYGPLHVRGERAGVLAVGLRTDVVLAGVEGKAALLTVLVGVAVLVALGIGLVTARAITRPVAALVESTRALRDGDLQVRAPETQRDEIGALAASFNAMAAELEASHRELEQKVVERTAELSKVNAELARRSSAKSAFLGTLSHELRTPLNGIIGFADMLSDPTFGDHSPDETRELSSSILASGRHLLGLINDLLDLAKIEAGKVEIKLQPASLSTVVAEVECAVRPLVQEKHLVLATDVERDLPRVTADHARLRQVLLNLVANAIKFTPPGGRVSVDATLEGNAMIIRVADTGPGIKAGEESRIFEPYERGDAGRESDGAGLGLALARWLIELQGGRIWVESERGRGSTFFVALPAEGATAAARAKTVRTATP